MIKFIYTLRGKNLNSMRSTYIHIFVLFFHLKMIALKSTLVNLNIIHLFLFTKKYFQFLFNQNSDYTLFLVIIFFSQLKLISCNQMLQHLMYYTKAQKKNILILFHKNNNNKKKRKKKNLQIFRNHNASAYQLNISFFFLSLSLFSSNLKIIIFLIIFH